MIALLLVLAAATGLDRDSLLTDAPAVAPRGTVRVSGAAGGTAATGATATAGTLTGSVAWTPVDRLAGDVGVYFQPGQAGPAARLRYQLLTQADNGVDVAVGARFKTVGFVAPEESEAELILAGGASAGPLALVLDGVVGMGLGEEHDSDVELRANASLHPVDAVAVGVDARVQTALERRVYDVTFGPSASFLVTPELQLQGLVGVEVNAHASSPIVLVSLSFDF